MTFYLKASSRKTKIGFKPVIVELLSRSKYSFDIHFLHREDAIAWAKKEIEANTLIKGAR